MVVLGGGRGYGPQPGKACWAAALRLWGLAGRAGLAGRRTVAWPARLSDSFGIDENEIPPRLYLTSSRQVLSARLPPERRSREGSTSSYSSGTWPSRTSPMI